jgi:L-ascorbate metabolism protein UlaG (beta-lactamase superfamily)
MPRRFANLDPRHRPQGLRAALRWGVWDRLTGRRKIMPPGPPAPRVPPDLDLIRRRDGPPRLTWIGHASLVGTLAGGSFLIDPVFARRVGWFYRRHGEPGLTPGDLPPLDALLVTHNHYDHFDTASCLAVGREAPALVPAGLGRWFLRQGFRRVVELGWWESVEVGPLLVTLVPGRHWSRRGVADGNRSLWGGFVVEAAGVRIYLAGDTAWFSGFAEIGRRFPGLTAAVLPIGGYEPAWFMGVNHLNPEEAGRAFLETGARHLVPIHWGAFQLTDEPLAEPAERLGAWWRRDGPRDGRRLHLPAVGETVVLT